MIYNRPTTTSAKTGTTAPTLCWVCPCGHTSVAPWDPADSGQRMIELVCEDCGEPYAGLVTADRGVYVRVGRITGGSNHAPL